MTSQMYKTAKVQERQTTSKTAKYLTKKSALEDNSEFHFIATNRQKQKILHFKKDNLP